VRPFRAGFGQILASSGHNSPHYRAAAILHTRVHTEQRLRATAETDFRIDLVLHLAS
jgi:hypothetical protein